MPRPSWHKIVGRRPLPPPRGTTISARITGEVSAPLRVREARAKNLLKISSAELEAQGFILFSYDSSVRVSELNPQGDYLEKVREALSREIKAVAQ